MVIPLFLVMVPIAACAGGLHHKGEHQLSLSGSFGHPFNENGRGDNAGVTLGYNYFFQDRFAFVGNLTPYRNYNLPGGDSTTGEFQVGVRWHFWEFELGELPVGLFAELLAGMMHGSRSVPEDGAHTNFVEDVGVGCELQVADNVYWITGCRLRHLSHAHVFGGGPNPGQDDVLVYTGVAISLN